MDNDQQRRLIEQFRSFTGTSSERAKFFLECAGWNSDLAIENFYENHQEEVVLASESDDEPGLSDPSVFDIGQPVPSAAGQPSPPTGAKAPQIKAQSSSRIATFGSLRKADHSSDDEEEEGQAFYAGGSESGGGQQILGPKKKKHESLVADMFKNAKEHGAEVLDARESREGKKKANYFQGAAYRLGGENDPGGAVSQGMSSDDRPANVDVVLRFWRNGFSVDNGPLRDFHDPANLEFLDDVRKGKIPRELVLLAKGSTVTLDMEDHSHEDFVKPKASSQAFSGQGYRLGNPTDGTLSSAVLGAVGSSVDQKPSDTKTTTTTTTAAAAGANIQVDESLPVTNIQIRLPDGSRLVSKFNHTHTVSDVRQYIVEMRPSYSQSNFVLMTTFPNREITDESATLSAANLINTVLVVRIK